MSRCVDDFARAKVLSPNAAVRPSLEPLASAPRAARVASAFLRRGGAPTKYYFFEFCLPDGFNRGDGGKASPALLGVRPHHAGIRK
jgi:hypothetical protein